MYQFSQEMDWATFKGEFFTNASGHPAANEIMNMGEN
jgi:hypothetical protein